MTWFAVSVTPRYEIETADRINSGGHVAYCPAVEKKYSARGHGDTISKPKLRPLFHGYIFIGADAAFHKDYFETSRVRLIVWRNLPVSEAQMDVVRSTVDELTAAAKREPGGVRVSVGDVVAFRNALFAGEPATVLEVRKAKLLVQSARMVRPVMVSADQVERV